MDSISLGSHMKNQIRGDKKNTHTPIDFISSLQWVKAGDKHHFMNEVSAAILEAMGKLGHTIG
jgi:hypothetical protein